MRFPRSLHARLVTGLVGILLLFGAFSLAHTLRASRLYAEEVQQKLHRDLAQHVVSHKVLLEEGQVREEAIKDLFHSLMVINPAIEIYLLDPEGEIITFSAPPGHVVRERIALEPIREYLEGNSAFPMRGDDPRHPDRRKIFSAAPILQDGDLEGYLYIVLASEEHASVAQMVWGSAIWRSSLGIALAGFLLAVVAGFILFRILTRRLRRLSREMETFREEVLEETTGAEQDRTRRGDDLDRLAEAFERMAQQIRTQIRELEETDELRRELVANVSHDLRTPLTHLQGFLETLLLKDTKLEEEERREYLQIALDQSHRLARLVADLLELSRLEARQIPVDREVFSASELVQDIAQKFRIAAGEKDVHLEVEVPSGLALVSADVRLIERVMENLLDNALRHTPEGGRIDLAVESTNDQVRVEIRDTGPGISVDEQAQIFERFHRGSEPSGEEGLGLGLAIAQRALELHDSDLRCQSRPGAGTSFGFSLRASRPGQGGGRTGRVSPS